MLFSFFQGCAQQYLFFYNTGGGPHPLNTGSGFGMVKEWQAPHSPLTSPGLGAWPCLPHECPTTTQGGMTATVQAPGLRPGLHG